MTESTKSPGERAQGGNLLTAILDLRTALSAAADRYEQMLKLYDAQLVSQADVRALELFLDLAEEHERTQRRTLAMIEYIRLRNAGGREAVQAVRGAPEAHSSPGTGEVVPLRPGGPKR